MSNRSKVSNSNNTIECYALEIILENFTYEDVKRAKELDGLLGIHNPDPMRTIMLFDTAQHRGEAYGKLNEGIKDSKKMKVAIIVPKCYIMPN